MSRVTVHNFGAQLRSKQKFLKRGVRPRNYVTLMHGSTLKFLVDSFKKELV